MTPKMTAIIGLGITWFLYDSHCIGKVTGSFTTIETALARSDDTIITFYSHKKSYFGQTFCQKNEVIYARIY